MCGRFTLSTPASELARLFDGLNFSTLQPRYNICPTQLVASIRHSTEGIPEVVMFRWGLVPFWAKDLKMGARMINARSETVASKPAYRAAFKKRRCLVIADGFYEWKKQGSKKQPYFISQSDGTPFALAGLWESWHDKSNDQVIETCTVLTTSANDAMQPLHDRMPVFLDQENHSLWLDKEFQDVDHLESLLVPCPSENLQTWPVSTWVNKAGNEGPECMEQVALPDA